MRRIIKTIFALSVAVLLLPAAFSAENEESSPDVALIIKDAQALSLSKLDRSIEEKLTELINKVEWKDSQKALRDALGQVKSGKIAEINLEVISQTIMLDAIKDTVSKNMGSNEAAAVNDAISRFVKEGKTGAVDSLQNTANGLIDKYVTGDSSKAALKEAVSLLGAGKIADISWKNLSQTLALDSLNAVIDKNMGNTEAQYVKDAIAQYVKNGNEGLSQSLQNSVNDQIDRYVKGDDAKKALKDAVASIARGNTLNIDFIDLGSKVAVGGVSDWIDRQDWSQEDKDAAKELLDGFAEDGIDGLTSAGKEILREKLTEKLGEEKANALITEAENFLGGKEVDWGTVFNGVTSIVASNLQKAINKQLEKLVKKYPALKGVISVVKDGISNAFGILTSDMSLKEKLAALSKLTMETLNKLIAEMKDFLVNQLTALLNNFTELAKKLLDQAKKIIDSFKELAGKIKQTLSQFVIQLNEMIKSLKDTVTRVKEEIQTIQDRIEKFPDRLEKVLDRIPGHSKPASPAR